MKKFYILTMIFALLGMNQLWANEAASANSSSDIVDGNVVISNEHVTFTLDGEKDFVTGDGGYRVYKSLGKESESPLTLSWTINSDANYSIAVTKISFKGRAYNSNALIAGNGKIVFNGETTEVGTASLTQSYEDISATGNFSSGIQIVCKNTSSGLFGGSFDFYIKDLKIEYTITPIEGPSIVNPDGATIDVTVDLEDKQIVNLNSYFTIPANSPKDFELGFQKSGGIIEGTNFYATAAGAYTVKAQIAAKENCHEASALTDAITITVNHRDQTLSWINESAIKTALGVEEEQTLGVLVSSGLAATFVSDKEDVLAVDENGKLTAKAVGEATITVSQAGNDQYNPAESLSKKFTVSKVAQTLSWDNEGAIKTSMILNAEQTIKAVATSELDVTYTSSKPEILSVDANGKLTAKALGKATITASQAGNNKFSPAESISKEFEVKEKETPFFNPNGFSEEGINALSKGAKVTLEVANVSDGLDGDFKATISDNTVLGVSREGNIITIEALKNGDATVTFTQKGSEELDAATKVYAFAVRTANTLDVAAEAVEKYVGEELKDFILNVNSNAQILVESSDSTIAYFDADKEAVVIPNSEAKIFSETVVNLTVRQEQNEQFTGVEKAIALTVKKYTNTIKVNGEAKYSFTLVPGATMPVAITSDNTELELEPIQESGAAIVALKDGNAIANYREGTAKWTIAQPENYKYLAANATLSIKVAKAEEDANLKLYIYESEANDNGWKCSEFGEKEWDLEGIAATVWFEAKKTTGLSRTIKAMQRVKGEWGIADSEIKGSLANGTFKEFFKPMNADATAIKFEASNDNDIYVRNVKVEVNSFIVAEDYNFDVLPGVESTNLLNIRYGVKNGGDLKIVCDNELFSFGTDSTMEYTISGSEGKIGTAKIPVNFIVPKEEKVYNTIVTIYNGVYYKTIKITANVSKETPVITWEDIEMKCGENKALNASVNADLEIQYEIVGETDVIRIEEGKIFADKEGEAQIKASVEGNDKYNAAETTITVKVVKVEQTITWEQELTELKVGEELQLSGAVASSGLDVVFESSDPTIAYIDENNKVHGLVSGEITIKAIQAGNDQYARAESEPKALKIVPAVPVDPVDPGDTRAEQTIEWLVPEILIVDMSEEAASVWVEASATSGLKVSFISSDSLIAYVDDEDYIIPLQVGTVTLTAIQEGDEEFKPATPISKVFTIINSDDPQTGLNTVNGESKAEKFIRNNQLLILRDGKIYNVRGQRVE